MDKQYVDDIIELESVVGVDTNPLTYIGMKYFREQLMPILTDAYQHRYDDDDKAIRCKVLADRLPVLLPIFSHTYSIALRLVGHHLTIVLDHARRNNYLHATAVLQAVIDALEVEFTLYEKGATFMGLEEHISLERSIPSALDGIHNIYMLIAGEVINGRINSRNHLSLQFRQTLDHFVQLIVMMLTEPYEQPSASTESQMVRESILNIRHTAYAGGHIEDVRSEMIKAVGVMQAIASKQNINIMPIIKVYRETLFMPFSQYIIDPNTAKADSPNAPIVKD